MVSILCAVAILYIILMLFGQTFTALSIIDNKPATRQSPSAQNRYTHTAEGQKIQYLEHLEEEEFKSSEGNHANLYLLQGRCKLTIGVYGETAYSYQTAYFHKNRLIHLFETYYRTSYSAFPDQEIPESKRIYQKIIFNPTSPLVQAEFSALLTKYITPENQKKC